MEIEPEYEYDVFLSFRGSDTRLTFTDCLYQGMKDVGIHVFLDSEELEDGEKISEGLLKALNESQIYIPIFSEDFASSPWCLREITRMVECTSESDQKKEIIPIFYDVKTDDVKLKTDLYREAILKHKEKFRSDELERWERALVEVGGILGRDLKGKRLGEQIKSIVDVVFRKLDTGHKIVTEHLVEDNAQVKAIMELLDVKSNGVRFVGIHGMGGVGKTTLATYLYNKLSVHFEGYNFLEDVHVHWQPPSGPLDLQKKLLLGFVSSRITDQIKDVDSGIRMIKKILSNKKVLIVLDDLDEKEQLEKLAAKSDWFCAGSRIIITTRDESILMTQVGSSSKKVLNQPKEILRYEVHEMRFDLALRLFYKHAFKSDSAAEEYDALSREIVCTVGMLPLAVVVIGSNLFDWGEDLGHSDKREVWDETLTKLKEGPFKNVRDTLMISYEKLEDKHQEVFLDIACFFVNADRTYPVIMWKDLGYFPAIAMRVLSQRSLIKIRDGNKFWMHDQVRDFGRYIVLQVYPRKFCRVWTYDNAQDLLERKETNEDVEALSLTFDGLNFTQKELPRLPNLKFFQAKEFDFSGNFKYLLPELRWLSWEARQTTFHASNFHFSKLIVLDLSGSNIKDGWGGWSQMKMDKLKVLDLTACIWLETTPNFSNFTSLEKLILAQCVKLTTIDGSIGKLKLLRTLNIKGCRFLQELPTEIGSLQSLTEISMPQNFQPFKLPITFSNLESLSSFILDQHPGISQLPNSIGRLVKVTHLSLRGCIEIKELPLSIGKMEMLTKLDLSKSGIVELPDSIGYLKKLKVIIVSYTVIRKFPYTIGQVEMLEELHAKKCWNLTDENLDEIGKLSCLRILDLSYTHISRFPTVLCWLSRLQTLEMSSSHLQEVPGLPSSLTYLHMQAHHFPTSFDLSSLVKLDHLELYRLTVSTKELGQTWTNNLPEEQLIHSLPSSLSTMKFRGISSLPSFSNLNNLSVLCVIEYSMPHFSISQELINLTELKLSKCELLVEIPGLSLLKNLQRLDLDKLKSLVEIQGLSELESLMYFRISHCDRVEWLPNLSKLDKLQHIELDTCLNMRVIDGVKGLESLKFDNRRRTILERLLDVSGSIWLSRRELMHDVFISFRGKDTRYNFTDFIYMDLVDCQVRVYRDEDELRLCDDIGRREILQVLDNCHIYIPILSPTYACSKWCLQELTHIVKRTSMSNGTKRIIPIFFLVKIADVNLQSNLYRSALDEHAINFGNEVEEWKMALREVAHIKGFNVTLDRSTAEVVKLVTKEVLSHLMDVNAEFD